MLTSEDREFIVCCLAWAGLQHWLCGREAGDAARAVINQRLDALRPRLDTQAMERLDMILSLQLGCEALLG